MPWNRKLYSTLQSVPEVSFLNRMIGSFHITSQLYLLFFMFFSQLYYSTSSVLNGNFEKSHDKKYSLGWILWSYFANFMDKTCGMLEYHMYARYLRLLDTLEESNMRFFNIFFFNAFELESVYEILQWVYCLIN